MVNRQSSVVVPLSDEDTADVPDVDQEQQTEVALRRSAEGDMEIEIISNLQEIDLFRHLECILKELHLLWELVITNEPIIVIGNSPSISSQVVQSLVR